MMKKKFRVLLVDDERELVDTLVERFELRGIEAVAVTSGAEALKQVSQSDFDVIVMDVKMPGIDGLETMKRIKGIRSEVQIILMTGRGSVEENNVSRREGAFDYLIKPVNIEELIRKMNESLDK